MLTLLMTYLPYTAFSMGNTYKAYGTSKLQVETCVCVGDMWADNWNNRDYRVATTISENKFVMVLYSRNEEAWNYYCKIIVKDFVVPDKKARKLQQKSKKWFAYDCDVEFYYNVEYPSIEECFANYGGFVVNSRNQAAKKRTVEGVVQFNPYFFTAGKEFGNNDDEKMVVNLFFDEVGYAIYFDDHLEFPKK